MEIFSSLGYFHDFESCLCEVVNKKAEYEAPAQKHHHSVKLFLIYYKNVAANIDFLTVKRREKTQARRRKHFIMVLALCILSTFSTD